MAAIPDAERSVVSGMMVAEIELAQGLEDAARVTLARCMQRFGFLHPARGPRSVPALPRFAASFQKVGYSIRRWIEGWLGWRHQRSRSIKAACAAAYMI